MFIFFKQPKYTFFVLGLFSFFHSTFAQDKTLLDKAKSEEIFAELLENRDPSSFPTLLEKAKASGLSEQILLESEMLYQIDKVDDQALAALLPRLLESRKAHSISGSKIFASTNDWDAAIEFVKAIKASNEKRPEAFKKHIKEAFWLNPAQAPILAPYIQALHTKDAMKKVSFDFGQKLPVFASQTKNKLSFTQILGEKKVLLLHFWSPWSIDSEEALTDFTHTATAIKKGSIAICSLLPQDISEDAQEVEALLQDSQANTVGTWLIDAANTISQQLHIRNIPTVILIDQNGSILYNGSTQTPEFWKVLLEIEPTITPNL